MEKGLTKNQIVNELTKSPHGNLKEYVDMGKKAIAAEAEFFAHMVAWNQKNGQVRDAKVALPVVTLTDRTQPEEFTENALAHVVSLDPRNLVRAVQFAKDLKTNGHQMRRLIQNYLKELESNWGKWQRVAVQHRKSLKSLYSFPYNGGRVKCSERAGKILFDGIYHKGTVFYEIAQLKNMNPVEAAGTIMENKIPFLIAKGALGAKLKEPALLLALIGRMSPSELVNNTKFLEDMGMKNVPALRAAYDEALTKAAKSKKNTLKATKAIENVKDEGLKNKLRGLQEKQIKNVSVDGNWVVLGDRSGSMTAAIGIAREVSGTLAKMVKGEVHLIFFDTSPQYLNVTGKSLDEIQALTKNIRAGGGTSIGCGIQYLIDKNTLVDGIAIVTDGGENGTPTFAQTYKKYAKKFDHEPTVYIYRTPGYSHSFTSGLKSDGIDVQEFDVSGKSDYYALPNLVQTMRVSRYSLIDEIMETPLLTLESIGIKAKV